MTATSAPTNQPARPNGGPGAVTYYGIPHPLRDEGSLLVYDPDSVGIAMEAARHGAPPLRRLDVPAGAGDERDVRGVEAKLRALLRGRARRATGWSAFYWIAGPALVLLWFNVAPWLAVLF